MNNQSYESITFEVETELNKPEKRYYNSDIKYILSSTFKRAKKKKKIKIYQKKKKKKN